ncbi:MAG: site-2 protease family protein [Thermoplasmata archaeon]|nr:site-2 protease family protein [Thermoplasmata archaeon]
MVFPTAIVAVVAAIAGYALVLIYLLHRGLIGPDRRLSLLGPALMIKTQRGRGWLDRVGRFRRLWSVLGDVGWILAGISMVAIMLLLIWEAFLVLQIPSSAAPSPQEALGIPGLNPIIPIGYGIVALVIGIVLHELAHGVVARSQQVGVKSLGILWCVIPIGAFVEQDDQEMTSAPRRSRARIAAAGVLMNFALFVGFFLVMSLLVGTTVQPNATGVGIAYVVPNSPAANASLAAGDIVTSVNGTSTPTDLALFDVLSHTVPNQTVAVTYYSSSQNQVVTTTIPLGTNPSNASIGFMGIGLTFVTPTQLKEVFVSPATSSLGPFVGPIAWLLLPLAGLQPIQGSTAAYFHLAGPLAGLGSNSFWILANLIYWLAWMNLLLGLSNSLPLVPLDGGLLFRDYAGALVQRLRRGWSALRVEAAVSKLSIAASLLVVVLIVWQFVAPRL